MRHPIRFLFASVTAALISGCAPGSGLDSDEPVDDFVASAESACGGECVTYSAPETLTYDELLTLSPLPGKREGDVYRVWGADPALEGKLNRLLTEPFVSNEAFRAGSRPYRPAEPGLGPTVRAAAWNIERGQELPLIQEALEAANDPEARKAFLGTFDAPGAVSKEVLADGARLAAVNAELDALALTDVMVLNEVDLGMKRSGYANVVAEVAGTLGMNYAYTVEFVEVDPIALGTEKFVREDFLTADGNTGYVLDDGSIPEAELADTAAQANATVAVDPSRSKNLHGNAILSRYPIVATRVMPLKTTDGCWDWNEGERKPKDLAGKGQDMLAEKIFLEKSMRQIRHGGRTMLMVDIFVPGLGGDGTKVGSASGERGEIVTVVNAHLEAKSTPACRKNQMKEILAQLAQVKNPVILAGDLNTSGADGRPWTIEGMLRSRFANPQWIAQQVVGRLLPYSGWAFTARDVFNWIRLKDDPTGINIPFILPNKEHGLFDTIEDYRFADGARFDFRGDTARTVNGTRKTLANSNQRDKKGFKTTFAMTRTLGIGDVTFFGRFKLDWMFVRGYAAKTRDGNESYRFAPHFPRALEELRDATVPHLSDHAAITVKLPIYDPICKDGACPTDPTEPLEYGDLTWEDTYEE